MSWCYMETGVCKHEKRRGNSVFADTSILWLTVYFVCDVICTLLQKENSTTSCTCDLSITHLIEMREIHSITNSQDTNGCEWKSAFFGHYKVKFSTFTLKGSHIMYFSQNLCLCWRTKKLLFVCLLEKWPSPSLCMILVFQSLGGFLS